MIDIGVNINHRIFLDDLDKTLTEMRAANVNGMVCIASDLEESKQLQLLCKNQPSMWNTLGCHPHQANTWKSQSSNHFAELIRHIRPVAIGETGLDFNRNYSTPDEQFYAFDAQIELAHEYKLPLYLHERDAHQAMVSRLRTCPELAKKSVIHCFTGSRAELDNYLALGLSIGITGWVCDERRGQGLQASVPHIPLDKLLLETDAPYLLPRNIRPRPKKNHPKYLPFVAQEVARLKGISIEELTQRTTNNTKALFGI
ncbi:TatD family hydrolase [Marinomonas transparens]|uniref:TatD family hydrolase n=1 Tax=Marinomonas transparens TaxID=2795388 RepID=A0A934N2T6_9GAMM|nr:TatD family hydrolase [Marinomonas transparens]MBJ7538208.1 TatD family hydrolase [Marinomonas transparens]